MKLLKLLLLFTSFSSFAQIRFEPGYFIDNAGARHDVLIKDIDWKNNPVDFSYKTSESTEIQQRIIQNTSEFGVGGNTYKRFDVKIDRSGTVVDQMSETPVIDWKSEALFLKKLVDGKLALYQYEDSNLVKYFYSEGNHTTATQLMYREYKQDSKIMKNTNFRQQLYNLMKDKYADAQYFKNTKYNRTELGGLFDDYNGVTADASKTQNKGKGTLHFRVTAGAVFSSMSVESVGGFVTYGNEFDNETGFRAGAQLEYIFPFNKNKWSLILDPNYQKYTSENIEGVTTWKADYQKLEVPILVRHYFYLGDTSKVFVNGAYLLNFSLGDSHIQRNATEPVEIRKNSSWGLGAGLAYNDFSLEARYVFNHGITDADYWVSDFSSFSLILAYELF